MRAASLVALRDVPVWMVLVVVGDGPLAGRDPVDRLGEAVSAQPGTLGASVAGGDEPSVLVSAEATDVAAAREAARGIVAAALERVGRPGPAQAMSVFAEDGRVPTSTESALASASSARRSASLGPSRARSARTAPGEGA
jgi:hypothetical protein